MDNYFNPLKHSVSILLIDDDPVQLNFYEEMFSDHPMYNVKCVSSAQAAQQIINSGNPVHLSILDCGIDDMRKDEFYLLKKFSQKIPFIIISGSADMERAFEASKLGAAGMIAKPPDMTLIKFWNTLSTAFLNYTILPNVSAATNPLLSQCCAILRNQSPSTVSEWAAKVNITDAYLRKLWSECFEYSPKYLLFLYNFYKEAFNYYDLIYVSEINNCKTDIQKPDSVEHRRIVNYYLENKKEFDFIRDKCTR